jgi:hypothetical protein
VLSRAHRAVAPEQACQQRPAIANFRWAMGLLRNWAAEPEYPVDRESTPQPDGLRPSWNRGWQGPSQISDSRPLDLLCITFLRNSLQLSRHADAHPYCPARSDCLDLPYFLLSMLNNAYYA